MHPLGQEVPGTQFGGEMPGAVSLHHIYCTNEDSDTQKRTPNSSHHPPASKGEAQHQGWEEQETQEEVQDSKPAVFGSTLTQNTSHPYG